MMKKFCLNLILSFFCPYVVFIILNTITQQTIQAEQPDNIKFGLDMLIEQNLHILEGKRVGVITNQTGVDSKGLHIADLLHDANNIELVALFGPEHGIRGNVEGGYKVETKTDQRTGVQIFSLYGDTKKPTSEMLRNIDVLIFDIQDIGARFYTYISTMSLAMEACAENQIPFIVLDRPNPITGAIIEGPVLEKGFESFVGIHPIALRHGMTIGELAKLFNDEGFLKSAVKADLTVIELANWKRNIWYGDLNLEWIKPSPNIPDDTTAVLYPGIGLLEATVVSEGRGTSRPFKNIGAPWIDKVTLMKKLAALDFHGIKVDTTTFIPVDMPGAAVNPKFEGQLCHGLTFVVTDPNRFESVVFGIHLICLLKKLHPDNFAWRTERGIDLMSGSDKFRKAVDKFTPANEIIESLKQDLQKFMNIREKYLLYD